MQRFSFLTVPCFFVFYVIKFFRDEATQEKINDAFWTYRIAYFSSMRVATLFFRRYGKGGTWLCDQLKRAMNCVDNVGKKLPLNAHTKKDECKPQAQNLHGWLVSLWRRLATFTAYFVCFVLGLLTFGFFLPNSVKVFLFCTFTKMKHDNFGNLNQEIKSLKTENKELRNEIYKIRAGESAP